MKSIGNKLYLTFEELSKKYLISEGYLKKMTNHYREGKCHSWANIKDPQDSRKCLVDYDSIPEKTKSNKNLPSKEELLQEESHKKGLENFLNAHTTLPGLVKTDPVELDWLLNQAIDSRSAHGYARRCGWYKLLITLKPKQLKQLGFEDKESLYDTSLKLIAVEMAKKLLAGQQLSNKRVLKRHLQSYKTSGVNSILSKRTGIKNAKKLTEEQENTLIHLYSDTTKPDYVVVHRLLMDDCETYGWPTVSLGTVKNFLNKPEIKQMCFLKRHGDKAYREVYDPVIKRMAPTFANAFWVMDGTPLELYFRDGKSAYNRFEIFVILDGHSWKIVGYSIGHTENTQLVKDALRMACTQEGCIPHQLQYDNSSAIKSKESDRVIKLLARYCTPAQVGNARAKIVEPFFKHLNNRILRYFPNYSGSNITAKSLNSQINRENLTSNFGNIPTENEALEQLHMAIALWNNQECWKKSQQSPAEKHAESVARTGNNQRLFSKAMEVDTFYLMPDSTYEFTNRGFLIEYKGEKYAFDVENSDFRFKYMGDRFQVKYDPSAMDRLYLYQMGKPVLFNGEPVFARTKTVLPMAIVDRKEGDQAAYNSLSALKTKQKELAKSTFEERVNSLPSDLKEPITVERVHKNAINKVRKDLKKLEADGVKTIPMPYSAPISLYGDEEEGGPIKNVV